MDRDGDGGANNFAFVLSGKGPQLACVLNPPVYLNGEYEMCMLSLQTYNSISNVTSDNNVFRYSAITPGKLGNWENILVPQGTYDVADLEKFIDEQVRLGTDDKNFFNLSANNNTLKATIKSSVDIDFTVENSIGPLLGFQKVKIQANIPSTSDEVVDINKMNAIDIMCNIVGGSYINGELSHILYHFHPNVPPGFKIVEVPQEHIYMPVNVNVLTNIIIRAVDQNGRLIDLRGEELTVYLQLRRKQ